LSKQTFIQGTIILMIAGMITRFLGFINRIVIARLMGEEGIGIYMMALPTLFLMLTLAQIGLPIAISKRVAEANANNDKEKIKKILTVSFFIITCTSIIFMLIMILFAPIVANYLLTDERTLYPLLVISPIIPIISFTSVIKGYFQGMQNMKPQSFAIIIEQIVRISSVFILVKLCLPFGVEFAAAGAMLSIIFGELVSLAYMVYKFKQQQVVRVRHKFFTYLKQYKKTVNELFSIAIPNTGSRLINSISTFLEPILVSQSLAFAGVSTAMATRQYGELTGYALPLLFLPTFITNSLSIALLPSIAEADAKNNHKLVHSRIHQSIRISFASSGLATIVLSLFAIPILTYMYGTSNASKFIVLMAPFFLLLYISAPLQSTLFALDLAKPAMWNSLIGSICKFVTLIVFTSNEKFGIMGVAIAMSASVVLVTLLHLATLYKTIGFFFSIKDLTKMSLLLIITYFSGLIIKNIYETLNDKLFVFLGLLLILTLIYIILLLMLRLITKKELQQIPILKNFF